MKKAISFGGLLDRFEHRNSIEFSVGVYTIKKKKNKWKSTLESLHEVTNNLPPGECVCGAAFIATSNAQNP